MLIENEVKQNLYQEMKQFEVATKIIFEEKQILQH